MQDQDIETQNIEAIEAEAIEAIMSFQEWLDQSSPEDVEQYLELLYKAYHPSEPAPF